MKQMILVFALAALFSSCGNNDKKAPEASKELKKTEETTMSPEAEKGLDLIAANDCLGCHKVEDRINGPAYREVANKYAGQPGIEDTLAQHIIKGHVGTWGEIPMTPHPNLSQEDARSMVKYILSLKQ
ncbi:MAG TPA: c-type cytochrome [Flavisolibacter sp.]|jgi:cytochrome c